MQQFVPLSLLYYVVLLVRAHFFGISRLAAVFEHRLPPPPGLWHQLHGTVEGGKGSEGKSEEEEEERGAMRACSLLLLMPSSPPSEEKAE